ncbi:MAG: Lo5R7ANS 62, partial [Thermoleophilia bacterium]|nr:Lo5R7ANS 62 [Thermoleophilia bacterium]
MTVSLDSSKTGLIDLTPDELRSIRQQSKLIATRCAVMGAFAGANKQIYARSKHFAMDRIASLSLVYWNGYLSSSAGYEIANPGATTYQAQIEDVSGIIIGAVTWGGQATKTAASGEIIYSDQIVLTRELAVGETFFVGQFADAASGICYQTGSGNLNIANAAISPSGEGATFGVTTPNRIGTGGAFLNTQGGILFRPAAIIGNTRKPSLAIFGDSRQGNMANYHGATDGYGCSGDLEPSLGLKLACMRLSYPGTLLSNDLTALAKRVQLARLCSHVFSGYGLNDLATRTA